MYLRFRKRRKPLAQPADPAIAPVLGTDEAPPSPAADWIPAEPAGEETPPSDISTGQHPNRGKANESSRGSHR